MRNRDAEGNRTPTRTPIKACRECYDMPHRRSKPRCSCCRKPYKAEVIKLVTYSGRGEWDRL